MNQSIQNDINKKNLQIHIPQNIFSTRTQRNTPAQIWSKRNLLKKLTIKSKFSKQQKKLQKSICNYFLNPSIKVKHNLETSHNNIKTTSSLILSPSPNSKMKRLSLAKAQNSHKYCQNFFASNAFATNGLRSYHYNSSASQGNNFINVSKINLFEKKSNQKLKQSNLQIKKLNTQRQQFKEQKKCQLSHKRSKSSSDSKVEQHQQKNNKQKDFFKVQLKQIHSNKQSANINCQKQDDNLFFKRSNTDNEKQLAQSIQKLKMSKTQAKRPQSCILKKPFNFPAQKCQIQYEFLNQGWNTKQAQVQQQHFSHIYHF